MSDPEQLRISFAERGMPEWRLARVIARLAAEAGLPLELERMAGGEARQIAGVHEGMAELSVNVAEAVRWAYRAEGAYDGWRHTSLRGIGTLWKPQWLAIAVRWGLGAATLAEIAERRLPIRALVHVPDGPATTWSFLTNQVLGAYGFTLRDVVEWGGRVTDVSDLAAAREGDFDLLVAPLGAHAGGAGQVWQHASSSTDLRFVGLEEPVCERFESEHGVGSALLTEGVLRGVGKDVRALWFPRYFVYATERLESETAQRLFEALASGREALLGEFAFFDPASALDDAPILPHAGARKAAAAAAPAGD